MHNDAMLGRNDIVRLADEALRQFVESPPENAHHHSLLVTSGTTGGAPLVSIASHAQSMRGRQEVFWHKGPVLLCMGPRVMQSYFAILSLLAPEPRTVVAIGRDDLRPSLTSLLNEIAPLQIIGYPSFIAKMAPYFPPEIAQNIRAINGSGERITPFLENTLARGFPNARISLWYGTAELIVLSKVRCKFQPHNSYHPLEGVRLEVLNPDEEGSGDIVASKFMHGVMIERYHTGDIGRQSSQPCACGEQLTIEIIGRRGHDYVKLGGALLARAEFDRVVGSFSEYLRDYRVEASLVATQHGAKGKIVLSVLSAIDPSEAFKEEFTRDFARSLFLTPDKTLADLVASGDFLPLSVVWTGEKFSEGNKDIKLRMV